MAGLRFLVSGHAHAGRPWGNKNFPKLCIIAGPEFKELQGHLLIMVKAQYGTRSGGARWHDRLFDILQDL